MALSPVVLIVAADEVHTLKAEPGFEKDILVFADTDAVKALQAITRGRPHMVVLGRAFVGTDCGAALINSIKTDDTLANCQIRVLAQASDYLRLVARRAEARLAPEIAVPGEPLLPAHRGRCESLAGPGLQALFLHQPYHALRAHRDPLLTQVREDTRAAIALAAPFK